MPGPGSSSRWAGGKLCWRGMEQPTAINMAAMAIVQSERRVLIFSPLRVAEKSTSKTTSSRLN